ncbi:DNA repair protein Rad50p [Trichomonascus vanleenenianus]|uniref:MRX complex DNA-binding subunit n=1 Tax=Trichomonascus vanleenenianus TaxID=2268995 RepID=UPI003ECA143F
MYVSSIHKLSILGIRSFDDKVNQYIQFSSPLTLIVGQNGTGKTTIIECLRYSTTGDLPPNSKGGAFIHDPKISGEREVLAQVKLSFESVNHRKMICTRSMQLTTKRTTRTFKTLEGQLLTKGDDGTKTTLNTRCADLDAQMPALLGVSKAVLDYVIFCHQEDSWWPLAEPSLVKKRFDEIFEATKFTKALDNIKTLRKEYAADIKLQEKDKQHLKSDKDRAEKAQSKADQLVADLETYKEQVRELQLEMDQTTKQLNELFQSKQEFQQVLYKLEQLQHSKKSYKESIARLSSAVTELPESTEELQGKLDNFSFQTDSRRQAKLEMEDSLNNVKIDLQDIRKKYNAKIVREGQLTAAKEAHESKVARRNKFIKDASGDLGLDEASSENVDEFRSALESKLRHLKNEIDDLRRENAAKEDVVSSEIAELNTKRIREEEKKGSLGKSIQQNRAEISRLQDQIDSMYADEASLEYDRKTLAELNEKLHAQQKAVEDSNTDSEIRAEQRRQADLEGELDHWNNQLQQASKVSDSRARLKVLEDDLQRRELTLNKLKDTHVPAFESTIGKKFSLDSLEDDLSTALTDSQRELATSTKEVDKLSASKSKYGTLSQVLDDKREQMDKEVEDLTTEIGIVIPETSKSAYEEAVRKAKKDVSIATANVEQFVFFQNFYQRAVKFADDSHGCILCERNYDNDDELHKFRASIEEKAAEAPKLKSQFEEELEAQKTYLDELYEISHQVEKLNSLQQNEIPSVEAEIAANNERYEAADKALEEETSKMKQCEKKVESIKNLKRAVTDILRSSGEIDSLKAKISNLQGDLKSSGFDVSTTDIYDKLSKLNEESKAVSKNIYKLTEQKNQVHNKLQALKNEISSKQLEISRSENQLMERKNKQDQIAALKEKTKGAESDIESVKTSLAELTPQIRQLEGKLRELKLANEERVSLINETYVSHDKVFHEFKTLSTEISQYRGDEELETCKLEVKRISEKIKDSETRINELSAKAAEEEKVLLDMKSHERELRDNLDLRLLRAELKKAEDEIQQLQVKNAEQEKLTYERETKRLQDRYTQLTSDHSGKMGEMRQMDDQLKVLNDELQSEFLNIHQDYRKAVLKLAATSHANEDLATYSKALDSAIMKYHAMKMEEINRIVDELWKRTYTGTDIDTIMIRSDNENAKGNRAYNYRVVMVKQDIELDMRGRCSAGQKVLASIIIRLALAECFGVNCGLIALDEPTTNLDADNIRQLAKSLDAIISMRQKQKNFQLIVITHDEHFLQAMNAAQYTDHFYKVSRNTNLLSEIKTIPIYMVTGG